MNGASLIPKVVILSLCGWLWLSAGGHAVHGADKAPAAATNAPPPSAPAATAVKAKPKIKLLTDGFPGGTSTPEGVACDLARAFINRDAVLFTNICLPPIGGGEARTNYQEFLTETVASMKAEAAKKEPSPGGPKKINKVYAARQLSRNGPASFGYAVFNFHEVMFVDFVVDLQNGKQYLNRTLVVKSAMGRWYVHPAPLLYTLLSMGLNEEADSTVDFSEAYDVEK